MIRKNYLQKIFSSMSGKQISKLLMSILLALFIAGCNPATNPIDNIDKTPPETETGDGEILNDGDDDDNTDDTSDSGADNDVEDKDGDYGFQLPESPEPADIDSDGDGLNDEMDEWPFDPKKPVFSSLWGANGELWAPGGRLPFVVFAGYHEGKDPLPEPDRVVANVIDFGATNTENSSNDTQAFLDAIEHAKTKVSEENKGVIFVPAGVYDIDSQLHLSKSGMILRGEGRDDTVIRFSRGLIHDNTAIGSDAKRRKLIVMGGARQENGKIFSGLNWQQWNSDFSAGLDLTSLPQRGDFTIRLAQPLKASLKQNIIDQGYRIRLAQCVNYGETSTTPILAESIYGGPDFAAPGSSGGIWVSQQFVVEIDSDNQTLFLDRPLRFSPSDESNLGGVRIAVRDIDNSLETSEIGIEHLTIELPPTDWLDHFGTEGQGGIDVLSDNSWVRNVHVMNADNGIEIDKKTFNNTLTDILLTSNRKPRRSGHPDWRYDAYGHHGITVKGRDHMVKDFLIEVSFVHDVTMNNSHGSVVMRGSAELMNMDHHRQGIYDNIWAELHLGNPARMWNSTGNPSEGYNSAAFNTFWNITSDNPEKACWPENGEGVYPQWGYHMINVIATDIQRKPDVNEGRRPFPYHPDNAHLEVVVQELLWPQNIYEAQRKAYKNGLLWNIQKKTD